jgi:Fe-S-cluster-containing hydrogenase component 2
MSACPVNAITIRPDTGAKVVLDATCVGCSLCAIACPFGTIFWDPIRHKAFKCDLCGGDPACVKACPTAAILYEEQAEPDWLGPWADLVTGRLLVNRAADAAAAARA